MTDTSSEAVIDVKCNVKVYDVKQVVVVLITVYWTSPERQDSLMRLLEVLWCQ